jgi:hypothetical protein
MASASATDRGLINLNSLFAASPVSVWHRKQIASPTFAQTAFSKEFAAAPHPDRLPWLPAWLLSTAAIAGGSAANALGPAIDHVASTKTLKNDAWPIARRNERKGIR